jgi:hypothetical protein
LLFVFLPWETLRKVKEANRTAGFYVLKIATVAMYCMLNITIVATLDIADFFLPCTSSQDDQAAAGNSN